jgi:hypothetical protein
MILKRKKGLQSAKNIPENHYIVQGTVLPKDD